jgi:hypothetical protein
MLFYSYQDIYPQDKDQYDNKHFTTKYIIFTKWLNANQFYDVFFTIYIIVMYNYLAEFFGTMFFIYIIVATGNPLAIGAALALSILLTANISGGHINPVVTIVMATAGKIDVNEIIPYIVSQVFGGLVALQIYSRYKI